MKKTFALILAFVIALCIFTACGDDAENNKNDADDGKISTSEKDDEKDEEEDYEEDYEEGDDAFDDSSEKVTNMPDATDAPPTSDVTEKSEEKEWVIIQKGSAFSDGVAFVKYKSVKDNRMKTCAIDKSGNILFEMEGKYTEFQNGIMVVDDVVYDKKGNIIASPEISGYDKLISNNVNGYVLALKVEESFSGDKYYIGVLNNKGEWDRPLSTSHPIIEELILYAEDRMLPLSDVTLHCSRFITGSPIGIIKLGDKEFYNFETNEYTVDYEHHSTEYEMWDEINLLYKYNKEGEKEHVLENIEPLWLFKTAFLGQDLTGIDAGVKKLYDYEGNVIMNLSEYNIKLESYYSPAYYSNDHLLVKIDNGTGNEYLCLFDKNGNLAFEPLKMDENDRYQLYDEGVAFTNSEEKALTPTYYTTVYDLYFYDYKGNCTEFTDFDINDAVTFYEGLACLQSEITGYYCYVNTKGEVVIE